MTAFWTGLLIAVLVCALIYCVLRGFHVAAQNDPRKPIDYL